MIGGRLGIQWASAHPILVLLELGPVVPIAAFVGFSSQPVPIADGSGVGLEISGCRWWSNGFSLGIGISYQSYDASADLGSYDPRRRGIFLEPRYSLRLDSSFRPFVGFRGGRYTFDADVMPPIASGAIAFTIDTGTLDLGWQVGVEWWSEDRFGLELSGLYSIVLIDATSIAVGSQNPQQRSGITGNAYALRAGVNMGF